MIDGFYHNYENYNFLDCAVGQFVFGQFNKYNYCFFRGHGNESCNLIGSLPGQYFPISTHGPR